MGISQKDLRILYQQSGNRCAFPGCTKSLVYRADATSSPTSISEVAHIVAKSLDGPRGGYPLPVEERDLYDNLILLCEEHHHIVDDNPASYPVEMLRRWKLEHEQLVNSATGKAVAKRHAHEQSESYVKETIYSSLFPVLHMPQYIYAAPCKLTQSDYGKAKAQVIHPRDGSIAPFIIQEGRIYCFNNLRYHKNPFRELIGDRNQISRYQTRDWWRDPDYERWFVQLLNQSLNKLTGRKGLNWDSRHYRYYFFPDQVGETVEITYQPLNQAKTSRRVVWEPQTRSTGAGKGYWFHLAVALRFHHVGLDHWCLSVRPEMHITQDGITPYPSEKIGRRVTRAVSHRFNYDLLGQIQFWRSFLSDDRPRILLSYGKAPQYVEISTNLMESEIQWPGMPEEHAKPFKNIDLPETLFSLAEFKQLFQDAESEFDEDEVDYEDEWEDFVND